MKDLVTACKIRRATEVYRQWKLSNDVKASLGSREDCHKPGVVKL